MDQNEDPRELERQIEQADRIATRINDPTTYERLTAWAWQLRQRLRQCLETSNKQEIRARARELWEQNGCPADRDLEFWLQAEAEINAKKRQ